MLESRLFACLELATFLTRARKLAKLCPKPDCPHTLILFPSQLFACLFGKAERSIRNLHLGENFEAFIDQARNT